MEEKCLPGCRSYCAGIFEKWSCRDRSISKRNLQNYVVLSYARLVPQSLIIKKNDDATDVQEGPVFYAKEIPDITKLCHKKTKKNPNIAQTQICARGSPAYFSAVLFTQMPSTVTGNAALSDIVCWSLTHCSHWLCCGSNKRLSG